MGFAKIKILTCLSRYRHHSRQNGAASQHSSLSLFLYSFLLIVPVYFPPLIYPLFCVFQNTGSFSTVRAKNLWTLRAFARRSRTRLTGWPGPTRASATSPSTSGSTHPTVSSCSTLSTLRKCSVCFDSYSSSKMTPKKNYFLLIICLIILNCLKMIGTVLFK